MYEDAFLSLGIVLPTLSEELTDQAICAALTCSTFENPTEYPLNATTLEVEKFIDYLQVLKTISILLNTI